MAGDQDKESKFHSASRKVSVNVVHGNQSRLPVRSNGAGNGQCEFCTLYHVFWMCPGFSKESVEKPWIFAKEKHLCFNCLGSHFAKSCKSEEHVILAVVITTLYCIGNPEKKYPDQGVVL